MAAPMKPYDLTAEIEQLTDGSMRRNDIIAKAQMLMQAEGMRLAFHGIQDASNIKPIQIELLKFLAKIGDIEPRREIAVLGGGAQEPKFSVTINLDSQAQPMKHVTVRVNEEDKLADLGPAPDWLPRARSHLEVGDDE